MKTHAIENNAARVFITMCAQVLADAPRGLTPRSRRDIAQRADAASADGSPSYLSLEFVRGDAKAEVSVDFRRSFAERIEQEGALFGKRSIETSVGWSSSGSTTPAASLVKAALFTDVALFAAELEQTFAGTYYELLQTKDERDAEQAKRDLAFAENALKLECQTALKGKRVGTQVTFPAAQLPAAALATLLADATSASTAGGKTYYLAVGDTRMNATVNAETVTTYRMPNAR